MKSDQYFCSGQHQPTFSQHIPPVMFGDVLPPHVLFLFRLKTVTSVNQFNPQPRRSKNQTLLQEEDRLRDESDVFTAQVEPSLEAGRLLVRLAARSWSQAKNTFHQFVTDVLKSWPQGARRASFWLCGRTSGFKGSWNVLSAGRNPPLSLVSHSRSF